VGYNGNPAGARRALRIPSFRTDRPGWADHVIQALLDREVILVDNVLVDGASMNPKIPVWSQLRRRLMAHGVRVPVVPPDDDEPPWFRGRPLVPTGATGCAG
jgi:hypothetical protein